MTWETTTSDGASDWEDKSGEESASKREEVTFQPRKLFEEEEELLIMEEEITFQDWAAPEGLTILTILAGETTALEPSEQMQGLSGIPARARTVLTRRRNFLRNGGVNTPLAESTLVERVAITILTSCPNADPEEVLREAKKAILNMRQDCRENVIAAVRENLLARGGLNPSEGIRDNSNEAGAAQMETSSLGHLSRPKPEHCAKTQKS
ncbi:hypothetical protein KFL_012670030 [Klebsormidium nitens]|uniref:Uncharacterized protein n=1 Tax=Klebsormidium nitens TaxID=105231 RepID=A0A1Y1IQU3_KLENI|nr:hypothetical protein KFL_012670030 [Klebsormidium nitens]|eukprot:GAQ93043.1 hypothetical protein KFL_012670030 [Klebsormidium nitens]